MSLFVSFSQFNNFRLHSIHHLAITFYLFRIFNLENQFHIWTIYFVFSSFSFWDYGRKTWIFQCLPLRMASTLFNLPQIVDKRHLCQEWWTIRILFEMTQGFWTLHYLYTWYIYGYDPPMCFYPPSSSYLIFICLCISVMKLNKWYWLQIKEQ